LDRNWRGCCCGFQIDFDSGGLGFGVGAGAAFERTGVDHKGVGALPEAQPENTCINQSGSQHGPFPEMLTVGRLA
jgi:hypothetical protein